MDNLNSIDLFTNPLNIREVALNQFTKDSGSKLVVSPNNVFAYTLGMFSELAAGVATEVKHTTESLYASRAQSTEDLFKHVSDYECVNLFSTPATCTLMLQLEEVYVLNNAVSFNDNYSRMIIPGNTVFTIGDYKFGIYYPIEIRVNKISKTISVVMNTAFSNPINKPTTNVLEHRSFISGGTKLIGISIPVYQFTRSIKSEVITPGTGFDKRYQFTDRFYAARVFANVVDKKTGISSRKELTQVYNNQIYDPEVASAIITVYLENNTVRVSIPQIYLTTLVSGTVEIELLTSVGSMNYDLPELTNDMVMMSFDHVTNAEELQYAEPLRRANKLLLPLDIRITGGSNGYTFEEFKTRIIENRLTRSTPITPGQVASTFKDQGFEVTKPKDGLDDRIFLAHKRLVDGTGASIASAVLPTYFTNSAISACGSIVKHSSTHFTIKPSTTYEFDKDKNACVILPDSEIARINALPVKQRVAEYNNRQLTKSLFHTVLDVSKTPVACAYDMVQPKTISNEFLGENVELVMQASLYSHRIEPVEDGYEIYFNILRTDDIKEYVINAPNGTTRMAVLVACKNMSDKTVYLDTEYLGLDDATGLDRFKAKIKTSFMITQLADSRQFLRTEESFYETNQLASHQINLESEFNIVMLLHTFLIGNTDSTRTILTELPVKYNDYVAVTENKLTIKLGAPVGELYYKVNVGFVPNDYLRYPNTKFATTLRPVYALDPVTGAPAYTVVDNAVVLTEQYPIGTNLAVVENREPRFTIKSLNASGTQEVFANLYSAVTPKNLKGLPQITDAWSSSEGYKIISSDALMCALYGITTVANVAALPTATEGTFVWVTTATELTPLYGIVATAGTTPTNGRLMYRAGGRWYPMIGGKDIANVKAHITAQNALGKYYGFAYMLVKSTAASVPLRCAFLTNKALLVAGEAVTGNEPIGPYLSSTMGSVDMDWDLHVNQWPWDKLTWYKSTNGVLSITDMEFILNKDSHVYCDYRVGQVIIDADGNPKSDPALSDSQTVFLVDMVHIDAKLGAATTSTYGNYLNEIRSYFRTYCASVASVKGSIMDNTRIFFEPIRSIGTGRFIDSTGGIVNAPLDTTIALRVYISKSAAEDSRLLMLLKARIVAILDSQIDNNAISSLEIAKILQSEVPDTVKFVDLLGINGDKDLQTLISADVGTRPHLKHELVVLDDGTIDVARGLYLDVVVVS